MDPPDDTARARFLARLTEPVDGAGLVVFRVALGVAIAAQCVRYLVKGWVRLHYIEPELHFTYPFFGWVAPWPGDGMLWHFVGLTVLATLFALGLGYRVVTPLLFLGLAHWFLLDLTQYNNHYYLEVLLVGLAIFLPLERGWSVDAWRKPELRSPWVPRWSLWLLRFQFGIVYVYGGLAKFDLDWLTGIPIRGILGGMEDQELYARINSEAGGLFLAWSGLALDLFIVPLLLWRRTRIVAFLVITTFHLANHSLFRIAVFPWLMIAATTIYFPPDWPRRLLRRAASAPPEGTRFRLSKPLLALLALHVVFQLSFPFRRLAYPGRATWTEEGNRFAWTMMLRHKITRTPFEIRAVTEDGRPVSWTFEMFVVDGEPVFQEIDARGRPPRLHLEVPTNAQAFKLVEYEPYALLQFAHHVAEVVRDRGYRDVEFYARNQVSLNGREPAFLVDPEVDLAAQETTLLPMPFLLPLQGDRPPEDPYGGRLRQAPR